MSSNIWDDDACAALALRLRTEVTVGSGTVTPIRLQAAGAIEAVSARAKTLTMRLQALIDWADLVLSHQENTGLQKAAGVMSGPIWDEARAAISAAGLKGDESAMNDEHAYPATPTRVEARVLDGLLATWAGLIESAEADFAEDCSEAETTGERPDLWGYKLEVGLDDARDLIGFLTTLRAAQRGADATFRDLGWHAKFEVTSAALKLVDGAQPAPVAAPYTCPDCGRDKALTVKDAADGKCPKWWAIFDKDAAADCEAHKSRRAEPAPAGTPMVACPNRDPLLRTAADQERG